MKRFSYFHGPILSFFSTDFYRDVGRNWRGTGLLYIAIMLTILWIPTAVSVYHGFSVFVSSESRGLINQIPAITIKNGQVSTDVQTPYFIKGDKGEVFAIIDTTGQYKSLEETGAKLLLTKNKIITKESTGSKVYDLTPVQSFYLDRARVDGWLGTARTWLIPVFYPLGVMFSFIFRTVQILVYALIGMAFANMLKVQLGYQSLMRLAAVALTPVLVLDLIFEFAPVKLPFWGVLGIAVGLAYVFFAVSANREPAQQTMA